MVHEFQMHWVNVPGHGIRTECPDSELTWFFAVGCSALQKLQTVILCSFCFVSDPVNLSTWINKNSTCIQQHPLNPIPALKLMRDLRSPHQISQGRHFHCHSPRASTDLCVLKLKVADMDSNISMYMIGLLVMFIFTPHAPYQPYHHVHHSFRL